MKARGVRLHYSFEESAGQRGAALHNPLFDLLRAVHEHGSIRHAALALGVSYRNVWGGLKRWEQMLGEPLVVWTQGQPARLTPFGDRLRWAETRARTRLTPHIEALRVELEHVLTEALDGSQQVLTMFASHDLALPRLRELAAAHHGLHIELRFAGSVDALLALARGRCAVAGFHVPPLPGGATLFARALKPLLRPGAHQLIGCLRRRQGLMLRRGHPLTWSGPADLKRLAGGALRFVNRQPGSGTRLLMDHLLAEHRIDPRRIPGYDDPAEDSHVAVAAAVASGLAEVGPGIEAAARQFGLDFLPLTDDDYYLVCLKDVLDGHPALAKLRAALASPAWPAALRDLAGCAPLRSGEVLALTQALPWWQVRQGRNETKRVGTRGGG